MYYLKRILDANSYIFIIRHIIDSNVAYYSTTKSIALALPSHFTDFAVHSFLFALA